MTQEDDAVIVLGERLREGGARLSHLLVVRLLEIESGGQRIVECRLGGGERVALSIGAFFDGESAVAVDDLDPALDGEADDSGGKSLVVEDLAPDEADRGRTHAGRGMEQGDDDACRRVAADLEPGIEVIEANADEAED